MWNCRAWVNGDVLFSVPLPSGDKDGVLSLEFLSPQQHTEAERRIEQVGELSPKVLRDLLHGLAPFSNRGQASSTGWSVLGGPFGAPC